jgi:hypothetical protein
MDFDRMSYNVAWAFGAVQLITERFISFARRSTSGA